jgi:NAD(P)-dependent dehydrogenase (short-subunit alcohol dehydrogenase family)
MQVAGRTVLITGGKRIGATVAVELAKQGADVAVSYWQSRAEAEQVVADVQACGRRAIAIHADLRCAPECRKLVQRVVETFGRLDALVAMASLYAEVPFDQLTEQEWQTHLATDLSASFFCASAAAPHMRRQGAGRIVFFADSEAASGRPRHKGYLSYFVAKSGVIALARALALELAADKILVNTLALGPILPASDACEEETAAVARATPLGCWGGAAEVAKGVVQLMASDYITGELIRLDGGRHLL